MTLSRVEFLMLAPSKPRFDSWVWKICWRRKWQLTPVFLPGESHGQRSLAGYHPRDHKESDVTEHTQVSLVNIENYRKIPVKEKLTS